MSPNYYFDPEWIKFIKNEMQKEYFILLKKTLDKDYALKIALPKRQDIFHAFKHCSIRAIKVVIIGQDPYHTRGCAHGLAFSTPNSCPIFPPSLRNIFKAIEHDFQTQCSLDKDLTRWSKQGVLLLNTILTVREGEALSHRNLGWEQFTLAVIKKINSMSQRIVFLLWGSYAQNFAIPLIDKRHFVLTTTHPSPFSANKGFLTCGHFKMTNLILEELNCAPINWL